MTFRNIPLIMLNAAVLLFTVGLSGTAAAAADCAAKPAHQAASMECRTHHTRDGASSQARTHKTVQTTIDSGEVTSAAAPHAAPRSSGILADVFAAPALRRVSAPELAVPASTMAHRLGQAAAAGPSPWRGHDAPAGARWPTTDERVDDAQ